MSGKAFSAWEPGRRRRDRVQSIRQRRLENGRGQKKDAGNGGASGFLGSRIVSFYRDRYEVCVPSHGEMDIADLESVKRVFDRLCPHVVVHCAAVSDVGACERAPENSWKINVDGSRNIAQMSAFHHAKCLAASSDQVYFGSVGTEPHREDEELRPGNVYGREKLRAEEECLKVNPECILLRLSWMYDACVIREGEHGDFFRILAANLKNSEELKYPVHDRRGITDVNEVVRNLEQAFQLKGGVYNFGSPNDRNTYETVVELFRALGWDTARLRGDTEIHALAPRNLTMDPGRLQGYGITFSPTVLALGKNGRLYFSI